MGKRLIFGAFSKYNVQHYSAGTWRLGDYARGNREYTQIDSWIEVAKLAEDAKMDFLMWPDDLGVGGDLDSDVAARVAEGSYAAMDHEVLIAALSRESKNLGFVLTSSVFQHYPFPFARRLSTLDWITGGRIGWNIVTGVSPRQFANLGKDMPDHDSRYGFADEYLEVLYKLWEGSWERDATLHGADGGSRWIDETKVHPIDHVSENFSVKGPHQVEPSPQGAPVLLQAGLSEQGTQFAAKHAEVQFMGGSTDPEAARQHIARVRAAAEQAGRNPDNMIFAPGLKLVVGEDEKDVKRKLKMFEESYELSANAGKLSKVIGLDHVPVPDERIDLAALNPERESGSLKLLRKSFPEDYKPTYDEVLRKNESARLDAGTPEQIADKIEALSEAGAGAILVSLLSRPGSLRDFTEMVAPELKRRGLMQEEYDTTRTTLRDKLFGRGDLLPADHTGARYRPGASAPAN